MGVTYIEGTVTGPAGKKATVNFLVDSGATQAAKEVLAIPVYPELTEEQKNLIVATVKGS